ncbi:acyl-CoA dehydrogenase family protein [Pseudonocardia sp. NPDC049154]|uniref:acyl-CoA dehydrogenase family protein n=1 Tax=Pseudonocardia sp. NPDC049154 TaxID=3155501 RepID=UPI0033F3D70D
MPLTLTDEQQELATSLRRFLADKAPRDTVRAWAEAGEGIDPAVWRQMAGQLGLQGIAIPEEYGGSGFGPVELGVVLEEMGRVVLPGPFFGTVALAGQALVASADTDAMQRWLPGIADGTLTATVALSEGDGPALLEPATTATPSGDGWTLSGRKKLVVDGDTAALLLVVAAAPEGPSLFAVEAGATGLTRRRQDALDITRIVAAVELDGTPAVRIGPAGDAAFLRRVVDLAVAALAAEQVGGASGCLAESVEYGKTRVQFGRPIGSFQAIKHKCADMLLEVEAARSAALHAISAADEALDELAVSAAVAGSYCAAAYTHAAKENIQIHGGIGFTWEHDAHLHLKRAKSGERLLGSPVAHRARLAALVGI